MMQKKLRYGEGRKIVGQKEGERKRGNIKEKDKGRSSREGKGREKG